MSVLLFIFQELHTLLKSGEVNFVKYGTFTCQSRLNLFGSTATKIAVIHAKCVGEERLLLFILLKFEVEAKGKALAEQPHRWSGCVSTNLMFFACRLCAALGCTAHSILDTELM